MVDMVEHEAQVDVTERSHETAIQHQLPVRLASLTPLQQEILIRRFGLNGGAGETLEAIGARSACHARKCPVAEFCT